MILTREEARTMDNKEVAKRLKFVKDMLRNKVKSINKESITS